MTQKPRRIFTDEQKAEAVRIVNKSGKPIHQVAKEMGLTESALRNWVKQTQIDHQSDPKGKLTTAERKELNELRRELKRVQMQRDYLTAADTFDDWISFPYSIWRGLLEHSRSPDGSLTDLSTFGGKGSPSADLLRSFRHLGNHR